MAEMIECLRCRKLFEPRKAGHVYHSRECRHKGPRREGETEPPSEGDLARLFDRKRVSAGRVDVEDWHPAGRESPWSRLDSKDSIESRRAWHSTLVEEGKL
jgi:hypothetical protein